jgi:hypothetical protein
LWTLNPTGEDPHETLHAFKKAHHEAIQDLRKKIAQKMPFIGRVQFTVPAEPGEGKHPILSMPIGPPDRTAMGRNLTPVMARLDRAQTQPPRPAAGTCRFPARRTA